MSNNETRVSNERIEEMIGGLTIWLQSGRSGGPDLDRDTLMALTELQALRSTPVEANHIADAGKMVEARPLPNPSPSDGEVSEADIEAALRARVPGGSEVWHWINGGGMNIDETHREVMRTILGALQSSKRGQP